MANSMKDRENAFENKFAHDAEMQFKAEARRNKLLGLWAADLLGKSGGDAEDYAREVIKEGDVFTNKIIGTALETHADAYAENCKM